MSFTDNLFIRETCRLCDSRNIELALELKSCPPVDAFLLEKTELQKFPLRLFMCRQCGHVQLIDIVNPKILFGNYIYLSSNSPDLQSHFRDYSRDILSLTNLDRGDIIVDIGSNDGLFLNCFPSDIIRVGIDPAAFPNQAARSRGVHVYEDFFSIDVAEQIINDRGRVKVITANNVFSHADDLGAMLEGVSRLLRDDGIFTLEVSYAPDMINNGVFDYIYHEHLSYHSIMPLVPFFARHGLDIFSVKRVNTKGGSIRVYASKKGQTPFIDDSVGVFLESEKKNDFHSAATFQAFRSFIDNAKDSFTKTLKKFSPSSFYGYGASATTTVLLHEFEIGDMLSYIVDDFPIRWHRFSPGYNIPTGPPDRLSAPGCPPVIILAWRHSPSIILRNDNFLTSGGTFLIPLPSVKVITTSL